MLLDENLTQTLTSDGNCKHNSVSSSQQYRIWPIMPQIEIHKPLELEADMEWNSNATRVTKQSSTITDSNFFQAHNKSKHYKP